MLTPWLPEQGLTMIHAPRGIGKTHIALGSAWAVAVGGSFLRWQATTEPRRVLLLDGEMPAVVLQERLARMAKESGQQPPLADYFRVAASDLAPNGLPDLSDPASQAFYAEVIADVHLVVIDNLSTLCRGLKENEGDSWTPVQNWFCTDFAGLASQSLWSTMAASLALSAERAAREDVLDTVMALRKPPDYQPIRERG